MFRLEPKVLGSRTVPSFSVSRKVTMGFLPGPTLSTATIVAFKPFNCFDRYGTVCAVLIPASYSWSPCGTWQVAQVLSSACGRPAAVWFLPVTQSMSSWQEPHAAREGFVNQTSDCEGFCAGFRPS